MKTALYTLLSLLALSYLAACAAIYIYQRSLIYFPQPRAVTAPESTMHLSVAGADIVVTVRAAEGSKAIVYFGGNGEDVSQNLETFVSLFPQHALYLMHYRGYGGSTGRPTEKDNVSDALALFDKVKSSYSEVTIIGRSLGSGVAIQVAGKSKASRLILVTPYDSIVEIGANTYPWLPIQMLALDKYESGKIAPKIDIPTTLIEAENDQVIPRASTQKLLSRFKPGIADLVLIEGVGHNDLVNNIKYREALRLAVN